MKFLSFIFVILLAYFTAYLTRPEGSSDELFGFLGEVFYDPANYTTEKVPPHVKLRYEQGLILMQKADFPAALDSFASATLEYKHFAEPHFQMGKIYLMQADTFAAKYAFEQALEQNSKYSEAYFELAQILFYEENYIGATEQLNLVQNYSGLNAKMLELRGKSYYTISENDLSLADLFQAIQTDSTLTESYLYLSYIYENSSDYSMAMQMAQRGVYQNPENIDLLFQLARMMYSNGQSKDAVQTYTRLLEISPEYHIALLNRGLAYFDLGELEKCFADYNLCAKLSPQYFLVYNNRGYAYMTINKLDDALNDLNMAISLNSEYATSYINRGVLFDKRLDYTSAKADFAKAMELSPYDVSAAYNYTLMAEKLGHNHDVMFGCNKIIEISSDTAYVNFASKKLNEINSPLQ